MKKAKRLTKRQRKEAQKVLKELMNGQSELIFKPAKPRKVKPMFLLTKYLEWKAKKKLDKIQERHEGHSHEEPAK